MNSLCSRPPTQAIRRIEHALAAEALSGDNDHTFFVMSFDIQSKIRVCVVFRNEKYLIVLSRRRCFSIVNSILYRDNDLTEYHEIKYF